LVKALGADTKIIEMISDGQRGSVVLVRAGRIFTTVANFKATISAIMNFRPDVESIESNPVILIRMIRPSSTSSSNRVRKARRKVSNNIVAMGDSEAIGNIVNDSRSKVEVTDSGRAESVKSHSISVDNIAHGDIQSSMGSESTAQTVASDEDFIVTVLVEEVLELVEEIASEVISVFNIEIIGGNSVVNGVEIVSGGTRFDGFFG